MSHGLYRSLLLAVWIWIRIKMKREFRIPSTSTSDADPDPYEFALWETSWIRIKESKVAENLQKSDKYFFKT